MIIGSNSVRVEIKRAIDKMATAIAAAFNPIEFAPPEINYSNFGVEQGLDSTSNREIIGTQVISINLDQCFKILEQSGKDQSDNARLIKDTVFKVCLRDTGDGEKLDAGQIYDFLSKSLDQAKTAEQVARVNQVANYLQYMIAVEKKPENSSLFAHVAAIQQKCAVWRSEDVTTDSGKLRKTKVYTSDLFFKEAEAEAEAEPEPEAGGPKLNLQNHFDFVMSEGGNKQTVQEMGASLVEIDDSGNKLLFHNDKGQVNGEYIDINTAVGEASKLEPIRRTALRSSGQASNFLREGYEVNQLTAFTKRFEDAAATKIQAAYRGRLGRKEVKKFKYKSLKTEVEALLANVEE
eukprot:COSAG01_NODE_941_length_12576_cov_118.998557_11_plen_348_part_01